MLKMSAASINPSPSGHSGYSASLPPPWETSVLRDHFSLASLPPLPPKPAPVVVAGSLYQKVTHSSPYFPFLIFLFISCASPFCTIFPMLSFSEASLGFPYRCELLFSQMHQTQHTACSLWFFSSTHFSNFHCSTLFKSSFKKIAKPSVCLGGSVH